MRCLKKFKSNELLRSVVCFARVKKVIARVLIFVFLFVSVLELSYHVMAKNPNFQLSLEMLKEDTEEKNESKDAKVGADKKLKHITSVPVHVLFRSVLLFEYFIHHIAMESLHIHSSPTPPPDCNA